MPLNRRSTIILDPHDNYERTPTIPGLPAEDEEELPTGPGLGATLKPMAVVSQPGGAPVPLPPAPVAAPVQVTPVPVMIQTEPIEENAEDIWADPPTIRSSGVPDWAPISALLLWAMVSAVALMDRI